LYRAQRPLLPEERESFLHLEKGDQYAAAYRAITTKMFGQYRPDDCGDGFGFFGRL
jgi:hypothetical protein